MGNDIDIFVLLCGVFIVFFHNNDPNTPGAHPRQYHLYTEHLCCLARLDQLLGLVTDRNNRWSHHHLSESVLMYSPMSNVNNNRKTSRHIYSVFWLRLLFAETLVNKSKLFRTKIYFQSVIQTWSIYLFCWICISCIQYTYLQILSL